MLHDLATAVALGRSHEAMLRDRLLELQKASKKAAEVALQDKEAAEAEKAAAEAKKKRA
jgi:negative regulator of replication initiation